MKQRRKCLKMKGMNASTGGLTGCADGARYKA
jgi:hypothetical protein